MASESVAVVPIRGYRGDERSTRRLLAVLRGLSAKPRGGEMPPDLDVMHYPLTVPIPRSDAARVVTLYDVQHHELPELFSRAERVYRALAYDRAARHADLVVTCSEHARGRIAEHLDISPERIHVVYLGIDHNRFSSESDDDERTLAGVPVPDRYVIYPANLWPHKNHGRLLQAFRNVDRPLELVLTGQTLGREAWLAALASELGIADRVHHLGHVDASLLPALYRRAEGMVFPSLYEGFGSPPLEAMACGCPVAAASCGALAEVCGEAAIGFDPRNVEDMTAAIVRLVHDHALREQLRTAGSVRARSFTWDEAASRHWAAYARACELRDG
jgi:glycosyltransferase involved in cell wall biosynthesis